MTVTNKIAKCFKGHRRGSGSYLKFNCWNIILYMRDTNLHYLIYCRNPHEVVFYHHCHLIDIKPRLLYSNYLYRLQSHGGKKRPCLGSWSFYSNCHDFHMLLIVVPTYNVSDSLQPHGLPGSSVHGILQARILEWVAISFFRESSRPRDQTPVSSTAGRFFTNWAMREAQSESESHSVLSDSLQSHGLCI